MVPKCFKGVRNKNAQQIQKQENIKWCKSRLNNRNYKDECVGASQGEQNWTEPVNTYLVPSSDSWFKLPSSLWHRSCGRTRTSVSALILIWSIILTHIKLLVLTLCKFPEGCHQFLYHVIRLPADASSSDLSLLQQKFYWRQMASILRFSEIWNYFFFWVSHIFSTTRRRLWPGL